MYELIDQRDIQRKTRCRYPSAVVVSKLLQRANASTVVDTTFGKGRFYSYLKPDKLIGVDPIRWEWIIKPDVFHQMTVFRFCREIEEGKISYDSVDVVVVDPPAWNDGIRYNRRDEYSYIIGTAKMIIDYSLKAARLLRSRYLLLHFNRVPDIAEIDYVVQFRWFSRYLYTENKNSSYYILYRLY